MSLNHLFNNELDLSVKTLSVNGTLISSSGGGGYTRYTPTLSGLQLNVFILNSAIYSVNGKYLTVSGKFKATVESTSNFVQVTLTAPAGINLNTLSPFITGSASGGGSAGDALWVSTDLGIVGNSFTCYLNATKTPLAAGTSYFFNYSFVIGID